MFPEAFIENTIAFFHKADIVNPRKEEVLRQVNLSNDMNKLQCLDRFENEGQSQAGIR